MPLLKQLPRFLVRLIFYGGALSALQACSSSVGNERGRQQQLVDRATLAVQDIFTGAKSDSTQYKYIKQAYAVMICPSILRMSVGIGGAGGKCVLVARAAGGSWSDPAFYDMSTASIGLQLGIQDSQTIMFVLTRKGLQSLIDNQFKFGAGASASAAGSGSGIEAATTGGVNTGIVAVQNSKGLYAGLSLEGSKLTSNSNYNKIYYNQPVGPEDILITMRVNNPGADTLRSVLSEFGTPDTTTPADIGNTSSAPPTSYLPLSTGSVKEEPLNEGKPIFLH